MSSSTNELVNPQQQQQSYLNDDDEASISTVGSTASKQLAQREKTLLKQLAAQVMNPNDTKQDDDSTEDLAETLLLDAPQDQFASSTNPLFHQSWQLQVQAQQLEQDMQDQASVGCDSLNSGKYEFLQREMDLDTSRSSLHDAAYDAHLQSFALMQQEQDESVHLVTDDDDDDDDDTTTIASSASTVQTMTTETTQEANNTTTQEPSTTNTATNTPPAPIKRKKIQFSPYIVVLEPPAAFDATTTDESAGESESESESETSDVDSDEEVDNHSVELTNQIRNLAQKNIHGKSKLHSHNRNHNHNNNNTSQRSLTSTSTTSSQSTQPTQNLRRRSDMDSSEATTSTASTQPMANTTTRLEDPVVAAPTPPPPIVVTPSPPRKATTPMKMDSFDPYHSTTNSALDTTNTTQDNSDPTGLGLEDALQPFVCDVSRVHTDSHSNSDSDNSSGPTEVFSDEDTTNGLDLDADEEQVVEYLSKTTSTELLQPAPAPTLPDTTATVMTELPYGNDDTIKPPIVTEHTNRTLPLEDEEDDENPFAANHHPNKPPSPTQQSDDDTTTTSDAPTKRKWYRNRRNLFVLLAFMVVIGIGAGVGGAMAGGGGSSSDSNRDIFNGESSAQPATTTLAPATSTATTSAPTTPEANNTDSAIGESNIETQNVATTTAAPTTTTSSAPATANTDTGIGSFPEDCENDVAAKEKEGHIGLAFVNLPLPVAQRQRTQIEDMVLAAYNQASGMCLGQYQRVLQTATMQYATQQIMRPTENEEYPTSMLVMGIAAEVNCHGCSNQEPLFSMWGEEDHQRRHRLRQRVLQQDDDEETSNPFVSFINEDNKQDDTQLLENFVTELNELMSELLVDAPEARVVYHSTITIDQVNDFVSLFTMTSTSESEPLTEAPSTVTPTVMPSAAATSNPTAAPTANPTAPPTGVPTEGPTAIPTVTATTASPTVAPTTNNDSTAATTAPTVFDPATVEVTRVVLIDVDTQLPVPGYEDLQDGVVLNRALLPPSLTFEALTSPMDIPALDFYLDDMESRLVRELNPPFSISSNNPDGSFRPFDDLDPSPDLRRLRVVPYWFTGPGTPLEITFTVVSDDSPLQIKDDSPNANTNPTTETSP